MRRNMEVNKLHELGSTAYKSGYGEVSNKQAIGTANLNLCGEHMGSLCHVVHNA